jgi:uncharacterized membrane protein (DUF2068 family)
LHVRGRPVGIGVLACVIAVDGMSHLLAAYDSLFPTPADWPAFVLKLLVGFLLLIKARGLWNLHHVTYWMVILLAAIGAATDVVEVLRGHAGPATYPALGWAAITVVYLAHPRVRAVFDHQR